MSEPTIDPEDLFWRRIEEQPGDPLPRLVYADWCDENDRPVMAEVQRWLAATGRYPVDEVSSWYWVSEDAPFRDSEPLHSLLPSALYGELVLGWRSPDSNSFAFQYATYREAERAVERAWTRATKRRWFGSTWRPDFSPVRDSELPPLPVLSHGPVGGLVREAWWGSVGLLFLIAIVLAFWPVVVSYVVLRHLRRSWSWHPRSVRFLAVAVVLAVIGVVYVMVIFRNRFE